MRFSARAVLALVVVVGGTSAFAPSSRPTTTPFIHRHTTYSNGLTTSLPSYYSQSQSPVAVFSTTESDEAPSSSPSGAVELSDDELSTIEDLVKRSNNDSATLEEVVAQALPTMHPSFIMKLRKVEEQTNDTVEEEHASSVAQALRNVLDSRLAGGREVLAELLNAGEIRKLDAAIGKFARQGKLDMAFFTVLNMNLQDASSSASPDDDDDDGRTQILQHVYTRCQEEVEKTVPGGVALLNKLLRTEMESIRTNQLEHYLCPQPNVITTPDGKELQLKGEKPVLVPPTEFMNAIADAVKQIRTVEKAGGTDMESAANLVESCRKVASEARVAIAKNYGVDSDELKVFEDGLMPVFRPTSSDSPYIQGQ